MPSQPRRAFLGETQFDQSHVKVWFIVHTLLYLGIIDLLTLGH